MRLLPIIPFLMEIDVQVKSVADATLQRLSTFNRRTLDVLTARIYSYFSLGHERTGTLPKIRR